ncbi:hypothetical protein PtrCC142_011985, partial [Pyrenophora tritici-repentis]
SSQLDLLVDISAYELQERDCIPNGLGCDILNIKCCSNFCTTVSCEIRTFTCEP